MAISVDGYTHVDSISRVIRAYTNDNTGYNIINEMYGDNFTVPTGSKYDISWNISGLKGNDSAHGILSRGSSSGFRSTAGGGSGFGISGTVENTEDVDFSGYTVAPNIVNASTGKLDMLLTGGDGEGVIWTGRVTLDIYAFPNDVGYGG